MPFAASLIDVAVEVIRAELVRRCLSEEGKEMLA
jgi:hypothetical protein